ncbi:FUSC family protein [uncultured Roseibium sp.]|uniref:FUSC family protein n=1 Tax=uncultured Roseibium sp. TaxID=1936171 RepID=UPI00262C0862|nr:FUSC family protein [uncultured Roseibium sp.]
MTDYLRVQSAFKLALALVLAYWIALANDWDKPYWAGIAIVACSLTSFGESIYKGLLRLGGTTLAIVVSILLLAFFGQERWLFVAGVAGWLAICCYMMFVTSRPYFWQTAAFVVPILVVGGGDNPVNDFTVFILRAQQTVLGILCFSLVYAILWPVSSRQLFEDGLRKSILLHKRLLSASLDLLDGKQALEDVPKLRIEAAEQQAVVESLFDAAVIDSFDVRDNRESWRLILANMAALDRVLQRLCLEVHDVKDQNKTDEVQLLRDAILETDARLSDVEAMLTGRSPRPGNQALQLPSWDQALAGKTHFERAAMSVALNNANRGLRIAARLQDHMLALREPSAPKARTAAKDHKLVPSPIHLLNSDMWIALVRVQVIFLSAVLCVFFIPGFPNEAIVIPIGVSIAMSLVTKPQASVSLLMVVALVLIVLVGVVHIVALPSLTTFWQLALLIFATAFLIAYYTDKPEQMVLRFAGLNLFLVGLQTDNHQQYSFLFFAVMAIGLFCVLTIIEMTRYFPISLRPERRTEALIKRFFASSDFVLRNSLSYDASPPGWLRRLLLRHHLSEIDTIPGKLVPWLAAIPDAAKTHGHEQDTLQIAASLEALSSRVLEFVDARQLPQAAPLADRGRSAFRDWRLAVAGVASELVSDPGAIAATDLEKRLRSGMASLEDKIETVLNETEDAALEPADYGRMYRILGAYRGVAEGVLGYTRRAAMIDWPQLRESRF